MLVLSGKQGEKFHIGPPGNQIILTILDVSRTGQIRLGFDGPLSIPVLREKVAMANLEKENGDGA